MPNTEELPNEEDAVHPDPERSVDVSSERWLLTAEEKADVLCIGRTTVYAS